jgi:hypothetical protein
MKVIMSAVLLAASALAPAVAAVPKQPALQISFGAETQLNFRGDGNVTTVSGDRVTARFADFKGNNVATVQADRVEILDGSRDAAVVLLTGRAVVVSGMYEIDAEEVQFDPLTGEITLISPALRLIEKTGGALTYECRLGTRLYRNQVRVEGDVDYVPYGSYLMITRCVNGKPNAILVFNQVP